MKQTTKLIAIAVFGTLVFGPPAVSNPLKADEWMLAQAGAPSGRGSTSGDPAASLATPGSSPTTGNAIKPSRSGSGTFRRQG